MYTWQQTGSVVAEETAFAGFFAHATGCVMSGCPLRKWNRKFWRIRKGCRGPMVRQKKRGDEIEFWHESDIFQHKMRYTMVLGKREGKNYSSKLRSQWVEYIGAKVGYFIALIVKIQYFDS
ncbi:hypothetical protein VNO77_28072 [Canavalia gladiata]|uniref:Uncharacterized protein n=1 Tax=Canavalia gladiata TaxID=3824 RepID=A0AAN9KWX4_CANGL